VKIWEFFGAALETMWSNRMRSILTMIGIIIGTAAVISIFALGQSASSSIRSSLAQFGNQGILFFPGGGTRTLKTVSLEWRDFTTVRDGCARCLSVAPVYDTYVTIHSGHANDTFDLSSDTDYVVDSLAMAEGRRFNADDIAGARAVANLLMPAKQELFGAGPAVGKYVRIENRRFLVVGVYAPVSLGLLSGLGGESASTINIPYTAYHHLPGSQIEYLQVWAKPGVPTADVIDEVQGILQHIHGPHAAFEAQDFTQQVDQFQAVIEAIAIGISAIGFIALVVGGIGVMNIMLVSVIERTREIGIRKAIGASRLDILWQFLAEAVAITLIGGMIGAVIGVGAALLTDALIVSKVSSGPVSINWFPILVTSLGFSVLVGIFFGTYPATRAAALSPIECLRHE
jgi:ABC-type antimicrobial peptide transport system permease subunit